MQKAEEQQLLRAEHWPFRRLLPPAFCLLYSPPLLYTQTTQEAHMASITITLEEQDLIALQQVILDEDKDEALAFVKNVICAKIPKQGSAPCDSTRLNPFLWQKKR
jgi:hypothetical protein